MKFGANVVKTALKGSNLAQTGNFDHDLNLKYTCRALPSSDLELFLVFFPHFFFLSFSKGDNTPEPNKEKTIKFLYTNADTLTNKISELEVIVGKENYDIID